MDITERLLLAAAAASIMVIAATFLIGFGYYRSNPWNPLLPAGTFI